ncbi:MAG: OmpH family outer membrane protein [bacterium]|nr:OmpH family outer membrane protein [bacterium]
MIDPITAGVTFLGLNIIRNIISSNSARKNAQERMKFDLANSEANRQLQREEGAKNRAMQRELALLNIANSEENRRVQREIQQRNENLQRELQANNQKFQLELAERNADLQRDLCYINHQYRVAEAQFNFQNNVNSAVFQNFLKQWPGVVPSYVLERIQQTNANIASLGIFLYRNSSGQNNAIDQAWNNYIYPVVENQLEMFCNKFKYPPYNATNIIYYHDSFRRDVHGGTIINMLQYAFSSLPIIVLECNPLPSKVSLAVTAWDLGSNLSPAPKHFITTLSYDNFGGISKCLSNASAAEPLANAVTAQFKLMVGFLFDAYNLVNFAQMPVFPLLASSEYEEYKDSSELASTPLADPTVAPKIVDMYEQLYDKVLPYKSASADRFTPELRLAYAESLVSYVGEEDEEGKGILRSMLEDAVRSWVGRRSDMKAEEWLKALNAGHDTSGKQLVPMSYCHRGDCDFLCELSDLLAKCDSGNSELAKVVAAVCDDLRPMRKYLKDPKDFEVEAEAELVFEPKPEPPSKPWEGKQVGDRFEFGHYPQGANGEVKPITWRILRHNSDGYLVIAEQGLDCKKYNEEYCDITWADCTLRRWLNDEFYKKAFSSEEQSLIKTASICNNAGPSTDDRIFLLSTDEATSFFANDKDREAKPTAYATKNGAYTRSDSDQWKGNTWWWLRSRGRNSGRAADVYSNGTVHSYGVNVNILDGSVRPAFLAI